MLLSGVLKTKEVKEKQELYLNTVVFKCVRLSIMLKRNKSCI